MNTFQITSEISTIYPDIQGQLCSKHTVHLNRVQRGFRKAFTMHEPTHYVISKPVISLARSGKRSLSMSLEQGSVIMYAAGEVGDNLNISSNFLEEELTLEANGKLINSQQDSAEIQSIKKITEIATEDLSLNILKGGFLYVHCSDGIEQKTLKESMLIGLFMGILGINGLVQDYTKEELINKLQGNQDLSTADIEAYFMDLGHRQLIIKGDEVSKVPLDSKYKMLLLSLDILGKQFYQISENKQYTQILEDLSLGKINVLSFFSQIESIQQKGSLDSEVANFCSTIKNSFKLKSYILSSNYAIFLVQNYKYAEVIAKISSTIHRIFSSQAQSQDKMSGRFSSKININSFLFSSVPSQALFVLDPSNSIWF